MANSNTATAIKKLVGYMALSAILLLMMPHLVGPYYIMLLSYGLIYAVAAIGFNLLLGYSGLLSFGHSAYFGVGAYTVSLMVKYMGVISMEAFLVGGLIVSLTVTALFGYICVRHTKIFFAILTLALSQVLWSLAFKFFWVTGGTDGLRVPTATLLGGLIRAPNKLAFISGTYYYYVLAIFLICVVLMWIIVNSPFGRALQAIRDNDIRAEFVGVRVKRYRWLAFMISGGFTGLAGALWAPLNGLTTPDILHWTFSGELVFLTVLGGFKTFSGPIIGAVIFTFIKAYLIGFTVLWQLCLGVVLVIIVLTMPNGLIGTLARWISKLKGGEKLK
ncbi:MAG: branched-chain amino acid ABC transporter permease [Desulfobacterales bacterium]